MSQLIPFEFNGHGIRVQVDDAGQPWWVAQEVCAVLDIHDVAKAVMRLRVKEKRPMGGSETPNTLIINESGLYRLIMRSNKPEAERFQDWVFEDVLPTIRKTGSYHVKPKAIDLYSDLQAIVSLAEGLAETRQKAEAAQAKAAQAEAKADLALAQQDWLTIRAYVSRYKLWRQFPESLWAAFGRYMTKYCFENNIEVRRQPVADPRYDEANAYHVEVMHLLARPWLLRHGGQQVLRMLKPDDTV